MKAAVIYQNGGLDQLVIDDVPTPPVGPNEVVIEVRAAALNHLDIWVRRGRPGLELSMPHILGSDAAGVVAAVGDHVNHVKVGDEVILNPGLSCGVCAYCNRGAHSECISFGIVGMSCPGTFAEAVVVPAVNVAPKPSHLSWEEAAALPLAYLTAWRMLMTRGGLKVGETVLIHGIGGGVALAALQIAKLANAQVIVTSSSNDKLLRAKEFGADETLNYEREPDIAGAVRGLTDGVGVDLIVDAVGAATVPINLNAARRGGRMVHCGVTTGAEASVNLSAIYWNHLTIMGSTMGSREDFRQLLSAVKSSRLYPIVDSVHPIERARVAMERMETGQQFGKIVLTPHILTGSGVEKEKREAMPHPAEIVAEAIADEATESVETAR